MKHRVAELRSVEPKNLTARPTGAREVGGFDLDSLHARGSVIIQEEEKSLPDKIIREKSIGGQVGV